MEPREQMTVVVAGLGRFGSLHCRVWNEAGARIVGLCDLDDARLHRLAKELQIEEVANRLEELLDRVRPHAVVVASDEASHSNLAITALARGCHAFVEKPLALSAEDAWRIHAAAIDADRQVVTGQISRFATPYMRMRRSVQAGRVGGLCSLRLRRDFSRAWYLDFGDRVHPVWESCIHDIDLAVSFAQRPVSRVFAVQSQAALDAAPSVVSALLEFDNGVIATVESAWLVPEGAPQTISGALELRGSIIAEAEVLGLEGVMRQRLVSDGMVEWTNAGSFVPDLSLWPDDEGVVGGALRREVDYAIEVFSGRRLPDVVPLHEVCWGVEAAEAIVKSLVQHEPVALRGVGSLESGL